MDVVVLDRFVEDVGFVLNIGKHAQKTRFKWLSIVSWLVRFSMKRWNDGSPTQPVAGELETDDALLIQFVQQRNVVFSTCNSSLLLGRGVVSLHKPL